MQSASGGGRVELREQLLGEVGQGGVEEDNGRSHGALSGAVQHGGVADCPSLLVQDFPDFSDDFIPQVALLFGELGAGAAVELPDALLDLLQLTELAGRQLLAPVSLLDGHGGIGGAFDQLFVIHLGLLGVGDHILPFLVQLTGPVLEVEVGLLGLPVAVEDFLEVHHSDATDGGRGGLSHRSGGENEGEEQEGGRAFHWVGWI